MAVPNDNATLLGLPRELRDLIYACLLEGQRSVPRDPDDAGERDPKSSLPCTIYFEPRIPRPALLQLKLCNRQLARGGLRSNRTSCTV